MITSAETKAKNSRYKAHLRFAGSVDSNNDPDGDGLETAEERRRVHTR